MIDDDARSIGGIGVPVGGVGRSRRFAARGGGGIAGIATIEGPRPVVRGVSGRREPAVVGNTPRLGGACSVAPRLPENPAMSASRRAGVAAGVDGADGAGGAASRVPPASRAVGISREGGASREAGASREGGGSRRDGGAPPTPEDEGGAAGISRASWPMSRLVGGWSSTRTRASSARPRGDDGLSVLVGPPSSANEWLDGGPS